MVTQEDWVLQGPRVLQAPLEALERLECLAVRDLMGRPVLMECQGL